MQCTLSTSRVDWKKTTPAPLTNTNAQVTKQRKGRKRRKDASWNAGELNLIEHTSSAGSVGTDLTWVWRCDDLNCKDTAVRKGQFTWTM